MYNPSTYTASYGAARQAPRFHQVHSDSDTAFASEISEGLLAPDARISPKFLYDALGSSLFTAITQLEEYYPTRCEAQALRRYAADIVRHTGPVDTLIDLGAGDCAKAESLFPHISPTQYVPVDISVDFLQNAVTGLAARHPELEIVGVGMDFFNGLELPPEVGTRSRLFFYPGSSIGNLPPLEAEMLLTRVCRQCAEDGGLLIGVDLVKDPGILEPAYDDALGVTAAFNLNILRHVNRMVGTDFDVKDWEHVAFFNQAQSRIEMRLRALRDVEVAWPNGQRSFARGDTIHTESSYKYRVNAFVNMLQNAGFRDIRHWTDAQEWFAVFSART
jgi:dimethylhistidine N-methyltransferase